MAFTNYVILPKYKLIYGAIPKAANSTMKRAMAPLLDIQDPKRKYHARTGVYEYCNKAEVIQHSDYFRVALVRNTWSRIYSCWHEKIFARFHPAISKLNYPGIYAQMPFEEFVRVICDIPDKKSEIHFRSQWSMITHKGALIFDLVLPTERIELFHDLVEKYTVTKLKPLTFSNRSSVEPYTKYYSTETIDLIYQRYKPEIDLLGFKFGTNTGSPSEAVLPAPS